MPSTLPRVCPPPPLTPHSPQCQLPLSRHARLHGHASAMLYRNGDGINKVRASHRRIAPRAMCAGRVMNLSDQRLRRLAQADHSLHSEWQVHGSHALCYLSVLVLLFLRRLPRQLSRPPARHSQVGCMRSISPRCRRTRLRMTGVDVGTGRQRARGQPSRDVIVSFHSNAPFHSDFTPHTSRLSKTFAVITRGEMTALTYVVARLHLCNPHRVGCRQAVMCHYSLSARFLHERFYHSAPSVTIAFHSIPFHLPVHATSARFQSGVHLDEKTVEPRSWSVGRARLSHHNTQHAEMLCMSPFHSIPSHVSFHSTFALRQADA